MNNLTYKDNRPFKRDLMYSSHRRWTKLCRKKEISRDVETSNTKVLCLYLVVIKSQVWEWGKGRMRTQLIFK